MGFASQEFNGQYWHWVIQLVEGQGLQYVEGTYPAKSDYHQLCDRVVSWHEQALGSIPWHGKIKQQ